MSFRYDVAISFAGRQRQIAEAIATRLDASGYAVFYDGFESARLWGSDLPVILADIYGREARYCLMVVSADYARKMWTNHERRHAIGAALKRQDDYVLPLRVDDTEVPGLPVTTGYVSLADNSLDVVHELLLSKLGAPAHDAKVDLTPRDVQLVQEVVEACYRRAIFTKMDSEIDMKAMLRSIADSLGAVQCLTPRIAMRDIQFVCMKIVRDLDEIERIGSKPGVADQRISNFVDQQTKDFIDAAKLRIVGHLLILRRRAGLAVQLPTTLGFHHFFSIEDANSPPRSDSSW